MLEWNFKVNTHCSAKLNATEIVWSYTIHTQSLLCNYRWSMARLIKGFSDITVEIFNSPLSFVCLFIGFYKPTGGNNTWALYFLGLLNCNDLYWHSQRYDHFRYNHHSELPHLKFQMPPPNMMMFLCSTMTGSPHLIIFSFIFLVPSYISHWNWSNLPKTQLPPILSQKITSLPNLLIWYWVSSVPLFSMSKFLSIFLTVHLSLVSKKGTFYLLAIVSSPSNVLNLSSGYFSTSLPFSSLFFTFPITLWSKKFSPI